MLMTTHWWAPAYTQQQKSVWPSNPDRPFYILFGPVESRTLPRGPISVSGHPPWRGLQPAPEMSIWCPNTSPEAATPPGRRCAPDRERTSSSNLRDWGQSGQWRAGQSVSTISSSLTSVPHLTHVTSVSVIASFPCFPCITSITYLRCLSWSQLSGRWTSVTADEARGTTRGGSKGKERARPWGGGGCNQNKLIWDAYGCLSQAYLKLSICQVTYRR